MSLVKIVSVGWLMNASTVLAQQSVSLGEIERAANRSGDKSMALLELVFGPVVRNPLAGVGAGGGMVAHMFMVLVSCMLAVGVVWALYHFVATMVATAQSGEFLGERKSSPWFVVRMGAGFTALEPIFGGYCGAQILMLWGNAHGDWYCQSHARCGYDGTQKRRLNGGNACFSSSDNVSQVAF